MKRVIRSSSDIMYRGYNIVRNTDGEYDVFFRDDVMNTGFKTEADAKFYVDQASGDSVTMYRDCKITGTPDGFKIDDPSGNVITQYLFETMEDAKSEIDDQLDW